MIISLNKYSLILLTLVGIFLLFKCPRLAEKFLLEEEQGLPLAKEVSSLLKTEDHSASIFTEEIDSSGARSILKSLSESKPKPLLPNTLSNEGNIHVSMPSDHLWSRELQEKYKVKSKLSLSHTSSLPSQYNDSPLVSKYRIHQELFSPHNVGTAATVGGSTVFGGAKLYDTYKALHLKESHRAFLYQTAVSNNDHHTATGMGINENIP